jgi:hypothetical protein
MFKSKTLLSPSQLITRSLSINTKQKSHMGVPFNNLRLIHFRETNTSPDYYIDTKDPVAKIFIDLEKRPLPPGERFSENPICSIIKRTTFEPKF